jgi:hypothetical protein
VVAAFDICHEFTIQKTKSLDRTSIQLQHRGEQ